ncbi:hypothetical protein AAY473_027690 [Plecturocebus cupreus]
MFSPTPELDPCSSQHGPWTNSISISWRQSPTMPESTCISGEKVVYSQGLQRWKWQPDYPSSASQVAGTTGAPHHVWLIFVFLVEMGFYHVAQAHLKLLISGDPPTSDSQSAGIIDPRETLLHLSCLGSRKTASHTVKTVCCPLQQPQRRCFREQGEFEQEKGLGPGNPRVLCSPLALPPSPGFEKMWQKLMACVDWPSCRLQEATASCTIHTASASLLVFFLVSCKPREPRWSGMESHHIIEMP